MDSHPPRLEVPIIHYLHPPNIGGIGGVMPCHATHLHLWAGISELVDFKFGFQVSAASFDCNNVRTPRPQQEMW